MLHVVRDRLLLGLLASLFCTSPCLSSELQVSAKGIQAISICMEQKVVLAQAKLSSAKTMTPVLRAKLIGQFILLTIGGIALVTLAWLALRTGRRYVQRVGETSYSSASRARGSLDDWARQRIVPSADDSDDSDNA